VANDVVIVSAGMMTAVGLSAAETAASVRSATMRFAETEIRDKQAEPVTLAEVPDEGMADLAAELDELPLTSRERRMLRLGAGPLRECLESLPGSENPPRLMLALPESETMRPLDGPAFLERFASQVGGLFDSRRSDASFRGRAGGLLAAGRAADLIRAGQAGFVLAGGIDTYRDPDVLGALDMEGRLKSVANLDGFIPGEGAAFLLLASRQTAAAAGLTPLAALSSVAEAVENGHLYSEEPYRGEGLATCLQNLIASGSTNGAIGEVYSSMNGESHWAKEWGVAFLRNASAFVSEHGMHHPADCYGDTGGASGPLMVGIAAIGISEGYRAGPCLVYGSSDRGRRAALTLSKA